MAFKSDFRLLSRAFVCAWVKEAKEIAANMPIIEITNRSSMRVKPFLNLKFIILNLKFSLGRVITYFYDLLSGGVCQFAYLDCLWGLG